MHNRWPCLALAAASVCAALTDQQAMAGRCAGTDPCYACTSCSRCGHCKSGGSCGSCKGKGAKSQQEAEPICSASRSLAVTRSAPPAREADAPPATTPAYFPGMSRLAPTPRVAARTEARAAPKAVAHAVKPPYVLREWRDTDGNIIVVGRMKWRAMNRIMLQAADGEPTQVFTEDLSEADLEWLEKVVRMPADMNFGRERANASTAVE